MIEAESDDSPDADILLVRLTDAPIHESEEIRPGIVFDFDKDGRIVGFEILEARQKLSKNADLLTGFEKVA